MRVLFCLIFLFGSFWELKSLPPNSSYSKGEELFALRIAPILQEKCFACHSEKEGKLKGDLDLSSLEGMIFGGETSEKVLVPQKLPNKKITQKRTLTTHRIFSPK